MKHHSPLFIIVRVLLYSALVFGISEAIFFDAAHPMEDGYFGEISLTEIGQEIILFLLFLSFLTLGYKWKEVQPVSNFAALFFLMAFIREFNFLLDEWLYPVLVVVLVLVWLFVRDFKKIKEATIRFFSVPAAGYLVSGFLILMIFSRLLGRSKFWRLLYSDDSYRLAKAATEEGIELMGNVLILFAVIEYFLFVYFNKRAKR